MREINKIILHHTASSAMSCREYYPILYNYHVNFRGYSDIGYHYIIDKFGNVTSCRDVTKVGAHCYGHNNDSIGIALIGNYDKHTLSLAMHKSLYNLISDLIYTYDMHDLTFFGHCEFRKTLCPGRYGMLTVQALRNIFKDV